MLKVLTSVVRVFHDVYYPETYLESKYSAASAAGMKSGCPPANISGVNLIVGSDFRWEAES